jgi:hypothetical protein
MSPCLRLIWNWILRNCLVLCFRFIAIFLFLLLAIVLGRWTEGSLQHAAVFAVYMKNEMAKETMMSCALTEVNAKNAVIIGADEHIKHLSVPLLQR